MMNLIVSFLNKNNHVSSMLFKCLLQRKVESESSVLKLLLSNAVWNYWNFNDLMNCLTIHHLKFLQFFKKHLSLYWFHRNKSIFFSWKALLFIEWIKFLCWCLLVTNTQLAKLIWFVQKSFITLAHMCLGFPGCKRDFCSLM